MLGYIGNTDYDWYSFLKNQTELQEVNFWQPSGRGFHAIEPGAPFFFKLKTPHYAIAGYGFFAQSSILPDWLAWNSFGIANGAPDFEIMKRRIEKYRRTGEVSRHGQYKIGCRMISQPVFFPKQEWITQPQDWSKNIVQGKTYDLGLGEGRRIWEQCLLQAPNGDRSITDASERYGTDQVIQPRLGQGTFRISVLDAYTRACAVSGEHSLPVLEAAHIKPYSQEGRHEVPNGLLLRADIHRLFDLGYVTVSPDFHFEVGQRLKEDYQNGKTYYPLHGKAIRLPEQAADRPRKELLDWHNSRKFLG